VGVLVTSALVVAQVPKANAPPLAPPKGKAGVLQTPRKAVNAEAAKKAQAAARAAQLENLIQQFMRQGRPSVRAELIFVRNICHLNMEQLRVINREAEASLKDAVTNLAEAQQQGRLRAGARGQSSQAMDGGKLLREHLASVMKKNLTPEQFARYQSELEKRDANRKQTALCYLVDALDRELYLTEAQREKLAESLTAHWDDNWCMCMEYVLYGNQFYPMGLDPYVTALLDDTQKKAWQGTQKAGTFWGFGGVWGAIMNDNDALEEELGEVRKAQQGVDLPVMRLRMREAQLKEAQLKTEVEVKKRIIKDAATKK
jgi:hypothetical protein